MILSLSDALAAPGTSQASLSSFHFVPYQLNQQKQVAQLLRDAQIADFDIMTVLTINNSL